MKQVKEDQLISEAYSKTLKEEATKGFVFVDGKKVPFSDIDVIDVETDMDGNRILRFKYVKPGEKHAGVYRSHTYGTK